MSSVIANNILFIHLMCGVIMLIVIALWVPLIVSYIYLHFKFSGVIHINAMSPCSVVVITGVKKYITITITLV